MPSNTTLNSGSGGDIITTKERTHDGDATKQQVVSLAFVTGTEGAYTHTDAVGGAGAVTAGVQRTTLASDDPAVVALQVIDDWDESDRAKANIIVGQAGVAAGAGAVGATVQRMTLASDDPAVAALQILDNCVAGNEMQVDIVGGGIAGIVDDAAFTPATSEVLMSGYFADETATDSVDEGDVGAARMSLDRKQYTIAHQETGSIYQNGTARTPGFAAISGNTNGDNTLLAAQGAGHKIRVTSLFLVSAGTTTVRFESGAGGTALSGVMSLIANTGLVLPHNPNGWFETAANTLLNMELNAAVQVSGSFSYIVVT
jgi:hypothetical protein